MLNQLEQIIELLEELNQKCSSNVIQSKEFFEIKDDLSDFSQVVSDLQNLLDSNSSLSASNIDEIVSLLIHIHLKLSDTVWHIDQVHSLVKRMAGNFRENFTDSE